MFITYGKYKFGNEQNRELLIVLTFNGYLNIWINLWICLKLTGKIHVLKNILIILFQAYESWL